MTIVAAAPGGDRLRAQPGVVKQKDARGWWLAALVVLWGPLLWRLTPAWSSAIEHAHGWVVPVFAFYFAQERGRWLPPARPLAGVRRGLGWGGLVLALAGLPVWLTILEANPAWPLAQWVGFAAVAGATLALVALNDGIARAAHFAFPVMFVTTALIWPAAVTTRLVAGLVEMNAQFAAMAVSAMGHPAVVSGSVIEVATGFVGIDEACSGLRSLQAVWMAGWFFGELLLLSWPRRMALAVAAMGIAVGGNALRTTALTWIAAVDSPEASARWHDQAGSIELLVTLVAVGALAWWFARDGSRRPKRTPAGAKANGAPMRTAMIWGVLAAAVPPVWFGWHEATTPGERWQWELVEPETGPRWSDLEVPEIARELLQPTSIVAKARRETAEGAQSFALLVRWDGDVAKAANAEVHDPSICLPASGLGHPVPGEPLSVEIDGKAVTFTVGRVDARGQSWHVFHCHWDAWLGRAREDERSDLSSVPRWRLARVSEGRRRGDAAYLALVTPAAEDETARAWIREWAPRLFARR